jgi:hypothetical protein
MQNLFPFMLALAVGFSHAFEADHLVAVSSLVTRRNSLWLSLKDGAFWGLGHTSTLLVVGSVFILGRIVVETSQFQYLEAGVGLMLIGLGMVRLFMFLSHWRSAHSHQSAMLSPPPHSHRLAYSVGLVHGLAGSGALVLSVLTQLRGAGAGLLYLALFGAGSVAGMVVAAGAFSLPLATRLVVNPLVRTGLTVGSSLLCIGLGINIVCENLLN